MPPRHIVNNRYHSPVVVPVVAHLSTGPPRGRPYYQFKPSTMLTNLDNYSVKSVVRGEVDAMLENRPVPHVWTGRLTVSIAAPLSMIGKVTHELFSKHRTQ
jgi:hypothetical protein